MSKPSFFSVPDDLADAWTEMVHQNRRLQAKNDPIAGYSLAQAAPQPVQAVAQRVPLTGRPGIAATVAGALNTIAAGPNSRAPLVVGPVSGSLSRGAGDDVHARGRVLSMPLPVQIDGRLDGGTGRPEVSVSGIHGPRWLRLPSSVRVYTTPSGELDADLPSGVSIPGVVNIGPGKHVIGTPDSPRRR